MRCGSCNRPLPTSASWWVGVIILWVPLEHPDGYDIDGAVDDAIVLCHDCSTLEQTHDDCIECGTGNGPSWPGKEIA